MAALELPLNVEQVNNFVRFFVSFFFSFLCRPPPPARCPVGKPYLKRYHAASSCFLCNFIFFYHFYLFGGLMAKK